jgi:hypothetical protein
MTPTDAEHVLRLRLDLTEARYSKTTVATWAGSLAQVPQADVMRAMRAIVATGDREISPASIHGWLRDETRRETMTASGTPPARDTGCHCQPPQHGLSYGSICEMHRRTGLDAIATIRAQRARQLIGGPA